MLGVRARGMTGVAWCVESENEFAEVEGGFGAMVFDATLPVGAEEVEAKGVGGGVDFGEEFGAKCGPLSGIYFAFEKGELDALAVVGAVFGNVAKAFAAGEGGGGDVVGDEDEHGLSPDEGWVVFEVAAEVTGEEGGLGEGDEAEGDGFAGIGMGEGGFLAFLPGGEECFAGVVGEAVGVGGVDDEVFWGKLAAVEEGDGVAVGEEGAEFFHEVEGEGGATGAVAVEEAELWVEAGGEEGGGAVVGKECVKEGEEGVGGVGGWAAGAAGEWESGGGEEVAVNGEGVVGGVALDAAECFEGLGWLGGEGAEMVGEAVCGVCEGCGGFGAFAGAAAEEEAGVGDFADEETCGEAGGGGGVGAEGVLAAAEVDVAAGAAADLG